MFYPETRKHQGIRPVFRSIPILQIQYSNDHEIPIGIAAYPPHLPDADFRVTDRFVLVRVRHFHLYDEIGRGDCLVLPGGFWPSFPEGSRPSPGVHPDIKGGIGHKAVIPQFVS